MQQTDAIGCTLLQNAALGVGEGGGIIAHVACLRHLALLLLFFFFGLLLKRKYRKEHDSNYLISTASAVLLS